MPETAQDEVYAQGDTPPAQRLLSRQARTVTDAEILRRDAPARLRARYATLQQWSIDAKAISDAGGTPTAAQLRALFDRFGKLCDGIADLLIERGLDS